jgi:hypothetical protein
MRPTNYRNICRVAEDRAASLGRNGSVIGPGQNRTRAGVIIRLISIVRLLPAKLWLPDAADYM